MHRRPYAAPSSIRIRIRQWQHSTLTVRSLRPPKPAKDYKVPPAAREPRLRLTPPLQAVDARPCRWPDRVPKLPTAYSPPADLATGPWPAQSPSGSRPPASAPARTHPPDARPNAIRPPIAGLRSATEQCNNPNIPIAASSTANSPNGSVANSEGRGAMACVLGGSYAAMPKIVWLNWCCAMASPLLTQRT
jgi:hypothetical protein